MFYPPDLSCTHTKLIFIELTNLALEIAKLIRACDGFPHSKNIVKKNENLQFHSTAGHDYNKFRNDADLIVPSRNSNFVINIYPMMQTKCTELLEYNLPGPFSILCDNLQRKPNQKRRNLVSLGSTERNSEFAICGHTGPLTSSTQDQPTTTPLGRTFTSALFGGHSLLI